MQEQPSVLPSIPSESIETVPFVHNPWPIGGIFLAVFLGCSLFVLQELERRTTLESTVQPNNENATTLEPTMTPKIIAPFSSDPEKKIVYTVDPIRELYDDTQSWLMQPDGSNPQQLDITQPSGLFKYPQINAIISQNIEASGSFFVHDLASNTVEEVIPFRHPDPTVNVSVRISRLTDISPDMRKILLTASFTVPCPTPTLLPPGEQQYGGGGYEECYPEPDNNFLPGVYVYDLDTSKATYIGIEALAAGWDSQKNVMYHREITNGSLKKVDLSTNQTYTIDNPLKFGYGAWYLTSQNKFVSLPGDTEEGTVLYITDVESGQKTEIDRGAWADLQPQFVASPDETKVLYEKKTFANSPAHASGGFPVYDLFMYDVTTGESKKVTNSVGDVSFDTKATWIDNERFVVLANTIEEDYYNANNYLVLINTLTGETTRITPESTVDDFVILH